jgi:hypothetical protein
MRTRWNMLQDGFSAVGISVEISRRAGHNGTEFIDIRRGSEWITIQDRYCYGKWAGWVVRLQDRDGFGRDILRQGKTVDSVVTAVQSLLQGVTA